MGIVAEFADRQDAGLRLAAQLTDVIATGSSGWLVLALPRGGVPVAAAIARELGLPLDVLLVRKLGVPGQPELAMGAIAGSGTVVRNEGVIAQLGVTDEAFGQVQQAEQQELERRRLLYTGGTSAPVLRGRNLLIVDDGLATGATMKAAAEAALVEQPDSITVAVPVGAPDTVAELEELVDRVVCLHTPQWLSSIGQWYADFGQTSDSEVRMLLEQAGPG